MLHTTTSKLELPSLASVQNRTHIDVFPSWPGYSAHYAKGGPSSDKLPSALTFSQSSSTIQQHSSSPRGLGSSILNNSTYPKKESLPTPPPSQQNGSSQYSASNNQFYEGNGYMNSQSNSSYATMDQYGHPHHMSQGQPSTPQTATSGGLASFSQPPHLQPQYTSSHGFPQFGFGSNGVSSSGGQPPMGVLPLPQNATLGTNHSPLNTASQGGPQTPQSATSGQFNNHSFDATGQLPPPGMKPRVAATLWEDEGSLCFQVEARGVCVARREGKIRPERVNKPFPQVG